MNITRVEIFIVHVPLRLPIDDSSSRVTHWGVHGIQLHTDEGLVGTGYNGTHAVGDELITAAIDRYYGPRLLGRGPFNVRQIWEDLHREPLHWIGRVGITTMAHACIDIALWDLMATAAGRWHLWRRGQIGTYVVRVTAAAKAVDPAVLVADNNLGRFCTGVPAADSRPR